MPCQNATQVRLQRLCYDYSPCMQHNPSSKVSFQLHFEKLSLRMDFLKTQDLGNILLREASEQMDRLNDSLTIPSLLEVRMDFVRVTTLRRNVPYRTTFLRLFEMCG